MSELDDELTSPTIGNPMTGKDTGGFVIDSADGVIWYAKRLAMNRQAQELLDLNYRAQKMLLENDSKRVEEHFGPQVQEVLIKMKMDGTIPKRDNSYRTLWGNVGFTITKPKVKVVDAAAVVEYLCDRDPENHEGYIRAEVVRLLTDEGEQWVKALAATPDGEQTQKHVIPGTEFIPSETKVVIRQPRRDANGKPLPEPENEGVIQ